jgi:hypothetical protein
LEAFLRVLNGNLLELHKFLDESCELEKGVSQVVWDLDIEVRKYIEGLTDTLNTSQDVDEIKKRWAAT